MYSRNVSLTKVFPITKTSGRNVLDTRKSTMLVFGKHQDNYSVTKAIQKSSKSLKRWAVIGAITGSKYLGTVEADTLEEATEKAYQLDSHVSFCHHCSGECEDPEISEFIVEEDWVDETA